MNTVKQDTTINIFAKTLGQECVGMRIRTLSRAVSRIYDEALRPHGIKATQLSILAVVSILGQAEPREICRMLHLETSTLSRNMSRMRTKGWLRVSLRKDRRAHWVKLTPKGNRILMEAFPAWREAQERATALLGKRNAGAIGRIAEMLWRKTAKG
ncbi:MAG: winged helix-turn-helix transcriptional regulator [Deltaproteobacteria bacterium]|nr:MAG: winged helix-turn-helix transcriptional regulator [Deltaproteobacteria bacterium]